MPQIAIKVNVELSRLRDLLTSAFEGGSNYWYGPLDPEGGIKLAEGLTFDDFREGGKCQDPNDYNHWAVLIPSTEGCSLFVDDAEGDQPRAELNLAAMYKGIELMANGKYAHHFRDFMQENDDATTGDVYLQLCLYGDVIYG